MKFTVISLRNKKIFINWINKIKNSPKKLNTIKIFNELFLPNENHYVEYFSNVDKTLFNKIFH